MRPHRWQPSSLPHPWDPPGKNTGVGCHFLLQCMKVKSESEVAQSCPTLSNLMDCSLPGSSIHGIFQARVLEWGAIAFSSNVGATLMKKKLPFWWMMLIIGESIYVWGKESESESHSAMFDSLWPHGLYSPWNSPGQNAGMGSLSLLQGIFPTQGLNPGLPNSRHILYQLSHKGSQEY